MDSVLYCIKRYLFLFVLILLFVAPARGESVFDLILPSPDYRPLYIYNYGYINIGYSYFNIAVSGERKHFLQNKEASVSTQYDASDYSISLQFQRPNVSLYANNLYDENDYFNLLHNTDEFALSSKINISSFYVYASLFYCNGFGGEAGIGTDFLNGEVGIRSSLKPFRNKFKYNVQGIDGEIPLNYFFKKTLLFYNDKNKKIEIYYLKIKPSKKNEDYSTDIKGNDFGGSLCYNPLPFLFELIGDYGEVSADFKYDKSPYARLDSLKFCNYLASASYYFWDDSFITTGIFRFKSEAGNESYLDLWPFSVWDLFLASRTRLQSFDVDIIMPYSSVNLSTYFCLKNILCKPSLSVGYYHLIMDNEFVYEEKNWELYPFISNYESKQIDMDPNIDGLFRLEVKFTIDYKQICFTTSVSQLVPVKFSDILNTEKLENAKTSNKKGMATNIYFQLSGYY